MKLFDYDGPLMSALIYIGELILLNVVYVLCCVPVVTIGAATAAMYKVTLDNANGYSGAVIKRFFQAFRYNFKKATIEWIVMLGVAVFLYIDFQIITQTTFSLIHVVEIVFIIVLFLYLPTLTFVFPIQAYYENTVAIRISAVLSGNPISIPSIFCVIPRRFLIKRILSPIAIVITPNMYYKVQKGGNGAVVGEIDNHIDFGCKV